jgi:hypothetical protein
MAVKRETSVLIDAINAIKGECEYRRGNGGYCSSGCPFLLDRNDFCGIVSAHMGKEWQKAPRYWQTQEIRILQKNQYTDEVMQTKEK